MKMEIKSKYHILQITICWWYNIYGNLIINLVDNLAEGIHKIKCNYQHDNKKKLKLVEYNTKIVSVALNTQIVLVI